MECKHLIVAPEDQERPMQLVRQGRRGGVKKKIRKIWIDSGEEGMLVDRLLLGWRRYGQYGIEGGTIRCGKTQLIEGGACAFERRIGIVSWRSLLGLLWGLQVGIVVRRR